MVVDDRLMKGIVGRGWGGLESTTRSITGTVRVACDCSQTAFRLPLASTQVQELVLELGYVNAIN